MPHNELEEPLRSIPETILAMVAGLGIGAGLGLWLRKRRRAPEGLDPEEPEEKG